MEQRIDFPDVSKKLIAQPFTLARPFDQARNVTDFQRARVVFFDLKDLDERSTRGSGTRTMPVLGSTVAKG